VVCAEQCFVYSLVKSTLEESSGLRHFSRQPIFIGAPYHTVYRSLILDRRGKCQLEAAAVRDGLP